MAYHDDALRYVPSTLLGIAAEIEACIAEPAEAQPAPTGEAQP
jgi:hypothetical protein